MPKKTRIALLAAAALALPSALAAQQAQPEPAQAPAAQAAPAQDEAARIQQRLAQLQQQALQDPAVKAQEEAFDAYMIEAMARVDPDSRVKTARAEALKAEVEAARTAGDNAKLNQLAAEAQELQTYFAGLRPRALALPDVEEKRKAFVQAVFTKMSEIDPEAQNLVQRLQELRSGTGG